MIRNATKKDINKIMNIYVIARQYMHKNGNKTQWINYPTKEIIEKDIKENHLYIYEKNNEILAVFTFVIGEDATYQKIDGKWLSNTQYGTIHRIASTGKEKGIFEICFNFCKSKINHIRIDTHENNKIMNYILRKNNFKECGIIYVEDKSPRVAYEYIENNSFSFNKE